MSGRILVGAVIGSMFIIGAACAQEPNGLVDPYAYKNYSCQTPQGKRSGYGQVTQDKQYILFQEDPQQPAKRYHRSKCRRINVMKIQKDQE